MGHVRPNLCIHMICSSWGANPSFNTGILDPTHRYFFDTLARKLKNLAVLGKIYQTRRMPTHSNNQKITRPNMGRQILGSNPSLAEVCSSVVLCLHFLLEWYQSWQTLWVLAWNKFFANFASTRSQKLPEMPGFKPQPSYLQPDGVTIRSCQPQLAIYK